VKWPWNYHRRDYSRGLHGRALELSTVICNLCGPVSLCGRVLKDVCQKEHSCLFQEPASSTMDDGLMQTCKLGKKQRASWGQVRRSRM
jgi:hypothetical protein